MAKKPKNSPKDLVAAILTFTAGIVVFVEALLRDSFSVANIVISLCFVILGFYFLARYTNPNE